MLARAGKKIKAIHFGGAEVFLDPDCALYWPDKQLLVLADMHLEKGSYFAKRGNPLPLYDTLDTLKRLEHLIETYQPKTIITLGDNIHDVKAFARMSAEDNQLMRKLQCVKPIEQWMWIIGNHDQETLPQDTENLVFCKSYQLDNICFTHDEKQNIPFQMMGHFHPKARFRSIRGKCFITSNSKIIMPSFGTYTGGLEAGSPVFKQLFKKEAFQVYLAHQEKIWQIPVSH